MLILATINEAHFVNLSTYVVTVKAEHYAGGLQITDEPATTVVRVPKTHNN